MTDAPSLPPAGAGAPLLEAAFTVARRLRDAGHRALYAGGAVRDLVMGRPPHDVDVATDATPDEVMALHNARNLYTRRNEGVSIWVVLAENITASSPDEKDPYFEPSGDKVYRHPTFYPIPEDVPHT